MTEKKLTLQQIADLTSSTLVGDPNHIICNVADIESATKQDLSFLSNPRYESALKHSNAGAIFVSLKFNEKNSSKTNLLLVENPSIAFQKVIEYFHDHAKDLSGFHEVHFTAIIHSTAKIGPHVTIGPYAIIDKDVEIGENSFIGSGSYIGPYTTIGASCIIHPRVTIRERCIIGNRVTIQPGAVVGSCGFGYVMNDQGKHEKLNQVGIVILEDDVEIGANTTIDRSRFKATKVCKGSKIDNLVQIAHGVEVGPDNIIAAQTGIAGSSKTGRHVFMGGQVGVAGHLKIADRTMIAARGAVTKSLSTGKYAGEPAQPIGQYNRNAVYLRKIEAFVKHLKDHEIQIKELQSKIKPS